MASNEINMKPIAENLQSFLTKKIENNAKEITEKIIEKMTNKSDELRTRIETVHGKVETAESLVRENQNYISDLRSESKAHQKKLAEQAKKIHELEKDTEDQIN